MTAAHESTKLSVVIRNWRRPDHLTELLLPQLTQADFIGEIIVSHGLAETAFDYASDNQNVRVIHRHDYELNAQYGLARGFFAAAEAANEAVLLIDDDMLVPNETLKALFDACHSEPDIMHGLIGRNPTSELQYDWSSEVSGSATLVLVKCCILSRAFAAQVCAATKQDARLQRMIDAESKYTARWNGEEIFASLLSIKLSGKLNRAYALPWSELVDDTGAGVSGGSSELHLLVRTFLLRYLVKKWTLGTKIAVS